MGKDPKNTDIPWHPGFYGAMEIEFATDKESLIFQREYQLSKQPLRMDLLIIRKLTEDPIQNEIGHIFKKYNIVEYKSPDDSLSIDDYYKTTGYACLYKGLGEIVDQIPAEEISISIFRNRYSRELFRALRTAGASIDNPLSGIYYIRGLMPFATQVIVTRLLKRETHQSLRLLSPNVKREDIEAFIKKIFRLTTPGDRNNISAVLTVSIAANQKIYEEIRRKSGMYDALRDFMKEDLDAAEEKGRLEGEAKGRLETIKNLMHNMKWTADQAMSAINIPVEKREYYKANL